MANGSGIQDLVLEVSVLGCTNLKNTEWISRQDPYVCIEYATQKFRTKTCTDGGKNPSFHDKFFITLIEGLKEFSVQVWNKHNISRDDFIASGRILLYDVLTQGFSDSTWPLTCKSGRNSGEIRVIMHFRSAQRPHGSAPPLYTPPPAPFQAPPPPYYPYYSQPTVYPTWAPPPSPYHPSSGYPGNPYGGHPPYS